MHQRPTRLRAPLRRIFSLGSFVKIFVVSQPSSASCFNACPPWHASPKRKPCSRSCYCTIHAATHERTPRRNSFCAKTRIATSGIAIRFAKARHARNQPIDKLIAHRGDQSRRCACNGSRPARGPRPARRYRLARRALRLSSSPLCCRSPPPPPPLRHFLVGTQHAVPGMHPWRDDARSFQVMPALQPWKNGDVATASVAHVVAFRCGRTPASRFSL